MLSRKLDENDLFKAAAAVDELEVDDSDELEANDSDDAPSSSPPSPSASPLCGRCPPRRTCRAEAAQSRSARSD